MSKLGARDSRPTALPFAVLYSPSDVVVDTTGNTYLADDLDVRVLKLPVQ